MSAAEKPGTLCALPLTITDTVGCSAGVAPTMSDSSELNEGEWAMFTVLLLAIVTVLALYAVAVSARQSVKQQAKAVLVEVPIEARRRR